MAIVRDRNNSFARRQTQAGFPQAYRATDSKGIAALARAWTVGFTHWCNFEHKHSGNRCVSPAQRLAGCGSWPPETRKPARWSSPIRNWAPTGAVPFIRTTHGGPYPAHRSDDDHITEISVQDQLGKLGKTAFVSYLDLQFCESVSPLAISETASSYREKFSPAFAEVAP